MDSEEFKVQVMAKCLQGIADIHRLENEAEKRSLGNRLKNIIWHVIEIVVAIALYRFLFGN